MPGTACLPEGPVKSYLKRCSRSAGDRSALCTRSVMGIPRILRKELTAMTTHMKHPHPHPHPHHPLKTTHKARPPQHPKKKHPKHPKKSHRPDYKNLFDTCVINAKKLGAVDAIATQIIHNRQRYEQLVQSVAGTIPWWFVGLVHNLEAGFSF